MSTTWSPRGKSSWVGKHRGETSDRGNIRLIGAEKSDYGLLPNDLGLGKSIVGNQIK